MVGGQEGGSAALMEEVASPRGPDLRRLSALWAPRASDRRALFSMIQKWVVCTAASLRMPQARPILSLCLSAVAPGIAQFHAVLIFRGLGTPLIPRGCSKTMTKSQKMKTGFHDDRSEGG